MDSVLTNILLGVLTTLVGGGLLMFLNGKAELKADIKEMKTDIRGIREDHVNILQRVTKVETKIGIEESNS